MTNVSEVEKMAELMQQMEENSPRVAALQYCLKQVAEKVEEAEKRNAELEARCAALAAENAGMKNGNGTSIEFRDFYAWWNIFNEDGLRSEDERMLAAGAWMARSGLGNTDTYQYVPAVTTATDAFLAEVRVQARNEGINYAASRLAAAFNHGFVDKPLAEVFDVVRMILDTKEELANSTLPAADGLSGEYAEEFIENSTVELRKGVQP